MSKVYAICYMSKDMERAKIEVSASEEELRQFIMELEKAPYTTVFGEMVNVEVRANKELEQIEAEINEYYVSYHTIPKQI